MNLLDPAFVVRLETAKGHVVGGGCLLPNHMVLTCAHVVNAALGRKRDAQERPSGPQGQVRISFPLATSLKSAENASDDAELRGNVIAWLPLRARRGDLALLALTGASPASVVPACLVDRLLSAGESLRAYGFPNAHPGGVWKGNLTHQGPVASAWGQVNGALAGTYKLQDGFSGCPLFDAANHVVGIVATSDLADDVDAGEYIPTATIVAQLRAIDAATAPVAVEGDAAFIAFIDAVWEFAQDFPYISLALWLSPHLSLEDITVPVRAVPTALVSTISPQGRESRFSGMGRRTTAGDDEALVLVAQQLGKAEPARVLIVGGPGSGKSTLLRSLARAAWHQPERLGLDRRLLPLPVSLADLSRVKSGSFTERLRQAIRLDLAPGLPGSFFKHWAQERDARWLLLLDGLDEVPAPQEVIFQSWLVGFLAFAREQGHHVVMSSRPTEFRTGVVTEFARFDLQRLESNEADQLLRKLLGPKVLPLDQILSEAYGKPTPLDITMAAAVFVRHGQVPERRVDLFGSFIDTLLEEAEVRGLYDELPQLASTVLRSLLASTAEAMSSQSAPSSLVQAHVAERLAREYGVAPLDAEVLATRFVDVMSRTSSLLTCRSGRCEWTHPTFREYLIAERIVKTTPDVSRPDGAAIIARLEKYGRQAAMVLALGLWQGKGQDVITPLLIYARRGDDQLNEAAGMLQGLDTPDAAVDELAERLTARLGSTLMTTDILEIAKALGDLSLAKPRHVVTLRDFLSAVLARPALDPFEHQIVWLALAKIAEAFLELEDVERIVSQFFDHAERSPRLADVRHFTSQGLAENVVAWTHHVTDMIDDLAATDGRPMILARARALRDRVIATADRAGRAPDRAS